MVGDRIVNHVERAAPCWPMVHRMVQTKTPGTSLSQTDSHVGASQADENNPAWVVREFFRERGGASGFRRLRPLPEYLPRQNRRQDLYRLLAYIIDLISKMERIPARLDLLDAVAAGDDARESLADIARREVAVLAVAHVFRASQKSVAERAELLAKVLKDDLSVLSVQPLCEDRVRELGGPVRAARHALGLPDPKHLTELSRFEGAVRKAMRALEDRIDSGATASDASVFARSVLVPVYKRLKAGELDEAAAATEIACRSSDAGFGDQGSPDALVVPTALSKAEDLSSQARHGEEALSIRDAGGPVEAALQMAARHFGIKSINTIRKARRGDENSVRAFLRRPAPSAFHIDLMLRVLGFHEDEVEELTAFLLIRLASRQRVSAFASTVGLTEETGRRRRVGRV